MENKIINYKGKDYKITKRTDNENAEFFEVIDSAIGKVTEAKSLINYASVFSVNTEAVEMAYKIISSLNELYDFAEEKGLYKPVDASPKFYYYEVFYFYNRKDTGSIYIKTLINIDDFVDEDDFLNALVDNNDLNFADVSAITQVEKINKKTYRDMTGKD